MLNQQSALEISNLKAAQILEKKEYKRNQFLDKHGLNIRDRILKRCERYIVSAVNHGEYVADVPMNNLLFWPISDFKAKIIIELVDQAIGLLRDRGFQACLYGDPLDYIWPEYGIHIKWIR